MWIPGGVVGNIPVRKKSSKNTLNSKQRYSVCATKLDTLSLTKSTTASRNLNVASSFFDPPLICSFHSAAGGVWRAPAMLSAKNRFEKMFQVHQMRVRSFLGLMFIFANCVILRSRVF